MGDIKRTTRQTTLVHALNVIELACVVVLLGCSQGSSQESSQGSSQESSQEKKPSAPSKTVQPPDRQHEFQCKPRLDDAKPADLKRLTKVELAKTLTSLFGDDVMQSIDPELQHFPTEDRQKEYSRMFPTTFEEHVEVLQVIATRIASMVTSDDQMFVAVVGKCAIDSPDEACFRGFLQKFGSRIVRRPISKREEDKLVARANAGQEMNIRLATEVALSSLLQSVDFLYKVERPSDESSPAPDSYAIANRLSYLLWSDMPDSELFDAARTGKLANENEIESQIARMILDPKAQDGFDVFVREWLDLDRIPFTDSDTRYLPHKYLQDAGDNDYRLASLEAGQEIIDLVRYHTWTNEHRFVEIMQSNKNTSKHYQAMVVYGGNEWEGNLAKVSNFEEKKRVGLLTRMAFLVEKTEVTRPIKRGLRVRESFLCKSIPRPNPDNLPPDALKLPTFSLVETTRQSMEKKTSPKQCMRCHTKLNPIGFVMEEFDAIGRQRADGKERKFDENNEVHLLDLDTHVKTSIDPGKELEISTTAELSTALAESPTAQRCFTKNWFRYAMAREEQEHDGCDLLAMHDAHFGETGSIKKTIALTAKLIADDPVTLSNPAQRTAHHDQ